MRASVCSAAYGTQKADLSGGFLHAAASFTRCFRYYIKQHVVREVGIYSAAIAKKDGGMKKQCLKCYKFTRRSVRRKPKFHSNISHTINFPKLGWGGVG